MNIEQPIINLNNTKNQESINKIKAYFPEYEICENVDVTVILWFIETFSINAIDSVKNILIQKRYKK